MRRYCEALQKVYGNEKFRYHLLKLIVDNTKKDKHDSEKIASKRPTSRH